MRAELTKSQFLQKKTLQNNTNYSLLILSIMKKLLLVAILAVAGVAAAVAQPRAIGGNIGYGFDVSYQHSLGEKNMIDMSLSLPGFDGIGVSATYDWINPFGTAIPWNFKGDWNWYMGVGAGGGVYDLFTSWWPACWYAGVVGHVGVEYNFWFPLTLSVDYHPTIGVDGYLSGGGVGFYDKGFYGVTIGVRYRF